MSGDRRPQLDGIRTFAVLLVIYQHTMRPQRLLATDSGAIGVVLFFVLSGFLITGLLLDARRDAEALDVPRAGVLGRFYIRRFLRIFPLYYAVIAVAWIVGEPNVHKYIGWLLLYGTNFLMARLGTDIGMATPFWSLAVEEQFYLFWPFIVLFAPRRRLPWIMSYVVLFSLATRLLLGDTAIWTALDGLAIGGLLAWAQRERQDAARIARWAGIIGLALVAVRLELLSLHRLRPVERTLYMFPWALVGAFLVERAARTALPRFVGWRLLTGIGAISYGIYVYHVPMMSVIGVGAKRGWSVFLLVSVVTIAVAAVSWHLFEKPINDQKRRWPYLKRPRVQETIADGALSGALASPELAAVPQQQ